MDHNIQALITKSKHVKNLSSIYQNCHLVQLVQDFAMIPITKEFYNELNKDFNNDTSSIYPEFEMLSQGVVELIQIVSKRSPVVYLETDLAAYKNKLASIVWNDGKVILGPLSSSNTSASIDHEVINRALKTIVVFKGNSKNEFDALGLGFYKNNEDFIKNAMPVG